MHYGVRHKIRKGAELNTGHWSTSISTAMILGLSHIQNLHLLPHISMALLLEPEHLAGVVMTV